MVKTINDTNDSVSDKNKKTEEVDSQKELEITESITRVMIMMIIKYLF